MEMKVLMLLRQPEEGFETVEEVVEFFNRNPLAKRVFSFYFGFNEDKTFIVLQTTSEREPDQNFWVICEDEVEGKEEEYDDS